MDNLLHTAPLSERAATQGSVNLWRPRSVSDYVTPWFGAGRLITILPPLSLGNTAEPVLGPVKTNEAGGDRMTGDGPVCMVGEAGHIQRRLRHNASFSCPSSKEAIRCEIIIRCYTEYTASLLVTARRLLARNLKLVGASGLERVACMEHAASLRCPSLAHLAMSTSWYGADHLIKKSSGKSLDHPNLSISSPWVSIDSSRLEP